MGFNRVSLSFGLIEVFWDPSISGVLYRELMVHKARILCFTRSKLQHGKYLSRQRVLSGAIIFLLMAILDLGKTNIKTFFFLFL